MLDAIVEADRTRVTEASLEVFDTAHVSLATLAKANGTSTKRLLRQCAEQGIAVDAYARGNDQSSQPFILRKDARVVCALPKRRTLADMRNNVIGRLSSYLNGLLASGKALPCKGGKPNKREIARASGIPRDALYDNAEAVAMLRSFENQYFARSAGSRSGAYSRTNRLRS